MNIANPDIVGLNVNNNIFLENGVRPIRFPPVAAAVRVDPEAIGLRVQNNLMSIGSGYDQGNTIVTDDTKRLWYRTVSALRICGAV